MKNLKVSETVDGSANLEILRVAQDDRAVRMRLPRLVPSLAMTPCFVILNEVKNLKDYEAVDDSTSLEILRYTQDDKT